MKIRLHIILIMMVSGLVGANSVYGQLSRGIGQRPGEMVNSGVFRATTFGGPVQITQTQRPGSIRTDFLVEAANIIVTQINLAVDAFAALLILRAGGTPNISSLLPDVAITANPDTSIPVRRKSIPRFKSSRLHR